MDKKIERALIEILNRAWMDSNLPMKYEQYEHIEMALETFEKFGLKILVEEEES